MARVKKKNAGPSLNQVRTKVALRQLNHPFSGIQVLYSNMWIFHLLEIYVSTHLITNIQPCWLPHLQPCRALMTFPAWHALPWTVDQHG